MYKRFNPVKLKELRLTKGLSIDDAVFELRLRFGLKVSISGYKLWERGSEPRASAFYVLCVFYEKAPIFFLS